MGALKAVLLYTFRQHLRTKILMIVVFFGLLLVVAGLVVSTLAMEERKRVLLNIGLGGIEFLALLTVVFAAVNLIVEEVESRSIYLILTHPIKRSRYVLGRYLGTVSAIGLGMAVMAVFHLLSLFAANWNWDPLYLVALLFSFGKILIMSAIAFLLSLFSTSAAASMAFTIFIWMVGHFSEELKFMAERAINPIAKLMINSVYYAAPNLSYFSYKDFWVAGRLPDASFIGWAGIYAVSYIWICMIISNYLFSQKEF